MKYAIEYLSKVKVLNIKKEDSVTKFDLSLRNVIYAVRSYRSNFTSVVLPGNPEDYENITLFKPNETYKVMYNENTDTIAAMSDNRSFVMQAHNEYYDTYLENNEEMISHSESSVGYQADRHSLDLDV